MITDSSKPNKLRNEYTIRKKQDEEDGKFTISKSILLNFSNSYKTILNHLFRSYTSVKSLKQNESHTSDKPLE